MMILYSVLTASNQVRQLFYDTLFWLCSTVLFLSACKGCRRARVSLYNTGDSRCDTTTSDRCTADGGAMTNVG